MPEALVYPVRECNLLATEIPPIESLLIDMRKALEDFSGLYFNINHIHDVSISLEAAILDSNFVDLSAYHEATAIKESAGSIELVMSEINERMKSLEEILNKKAVIPTFLSTTNDLSVAFHMAINGSEIDWPFAEFVLERFLILWTDEKAKVEDSIFRQNVWNSSNFERNMIRLLQGGDFWRLRKSLKLIHKIIDDTDSLTVSSKVFNSLASILLCPMRSSDEDVERRWIYLIAKNREMSIDPGICRVINSFPYSQKGEICIAQNVLEIISSFINGDFCEGANEENFSYAEDMPKALVEILCEKKGNGSVIEVCLELLNSLEDNGWSEIFEKLVKCGICEALITLIKVYPHIENRVRLAIDVMLVILPYGANLGKFLNQELYVALVNVFHSQYHYEKLSLLVENIVDCLHDGPNCFHDLGITEGSSFFG